MTSPDTTAAERRAAVLVDAFLAGDGEALRAAGDEAFAAAAKPQEFAELRAALGPLRARGALVIEACGDLVFVEARVDFANGPCALRLALRGKALAGFFVAPVEPPAEPWSPPSYVDPLRFTERETKLGPLPATLTSPNGRALPPVCLFVHGSGPNDQDESIGPNKPFRDLGHGLATRGIASFRYDKRTRVLPGDFAALSAPTVKDEVLDDVAAALRQLRLEEVVAASKIVVVGHSLGAMLAPRIAAESGDVSGLVMIAPAARPLVDVTLSQFEYLEGLSPSGQLDRIRADVVRVRAARPGDAGPPFLGAPLSWWADMNLCDPVAAARRLATPMLILHGGRDYQVTDADFELFRAGLSGRGNVRLSRFAELNHLMMPGSGLSAPAEYRQPGHVDVGVVDAVAEFVLLL